MTSAPEENEALIEARVKLSLFGQPFEAEMRVPAGPVKPRRMLPLFQSVAEAMVSAAVGGAEKEGLSISCKKGCGACCRQLVPISETEAHQLKELVDELPEDSRRAVTARFQEARERLKEAGLVETLRAGQKPTGSEFRELSLRYFGLAIACPFLVDESCSIHTDRPIVCREYLVVSPPENCARQNSEPIRCLNVPAEVSKAVSNLGRARDASFDRWVPLSLALEWAEENPETDAATPGPLLVEELFDRLDSRPD